MLRSKRVIAVENLQIEREVVILRGINWTVTPGEHWAILGPNGSGKTSLLRALTGYLPPTRGRLEVCGEVYGQSNWPELRKRVGLVSSALSQRIESGETALDVVLSGPEAQINFWGKIDESLRIEALYYLRQVD